MNNKILRVIERRLNYNEPRSQPPIEWDICDSNLIDAQGLSLNDIYVCECIHSQIYNIFYLPFPMQIMDDRWEAEVIEFGAINITGFRIVDTNRRNVKEFLEVWKRLDPASTQGAGRESISVSAYLTFIHFDLEPRSFLIFHLLLL